MERTFDIQANTILRQALARPASEQAALVDLACGGDRALRRRVEELLAADTQSLPPLEVSGFTATRDRRIGAYRLVRRLGAGGAGVVYLARRTDGEYSREVAIKVLRKGFDTPDLVRRFLEERQILAQLQHPYIANLLDGGSTEDGSPYIVMEFVDGERIDRHCSNHGLTTRGRVELFLKVCAAVQYAHGQLVVHRDLKPSNILVTQRGEPKLLDFGIAKALSPDGLDTGMTTTGHRLLSPWYASPEQIQGKPISVSSDVYSLGVVLYELLTGRRPYQSKPPSPEALIRAICDSEPQRPSQAVAEGPPAGTHGVKPDKRTLDAEARLLRRRLQGDLDHILLKALRPEPYRRYASVDHFAEDLRRHLNRKPVAARRGTISYRATKFVTRRHRELLVAAAFLVLLTASFLRILQERDVAEAERDKLRTVSELHERLFLEANPLEDSANQSVREFMKSRAEVLDTLAPQPELHATNLHALGRLYRGLGLYEEALSTLHRAIGIRRELYGDLHLDVADTEREIGVVLAITGRYPEAMQTFLRVSKVEERLGSKGGSRGETLAYLGSVHEIQGEYARAESFLERALTVQKKAHGHDSVQVAMTLGRLAHLNYVQGELARAEPLYKRALEIYEGTVGSRHPHAAADLVGLALLYKTQGRLGEAEELYRRALAIREETLGPDQIQVAESLNNLGTLYETQGRYREAEELLTRAVSIHEKTLGPDHPGLATNLNNLARVYFLLGDYEASEPLHRRALEINERALGPDHRRVATSQMNLASLFQARGEYEEAEALYRKALETFDKKLGPKHLHLASGLERLASLYTSTGDYGEAETLLTRARAIKEGALDADHHEIAITQAQLAALYERKGRLGEASSLYQRALTTLLRRLPQHPTVGSTLAAMARLRHRQGDSEGGEGLARRAIAVLARSLPDGHASRLYAEGVLGTCLSSLGRSGEADALLERAAPALLALRGPHPRETKDLLHWLQEHKDRTVAQNGPIPAAARLAD